MERGKLGLIVNPVAGLGGSVGLKGTDHVAAEALRRGAVPQAERRAADALARLLPLREQITVYTGRGPLGENAARSLGFTCVCAEEIGCAATDGETTAALGAWIQAQGADLTLFAGGDGTARDVCRTAGPSGVFLGIPAGVKIHSPVYARSPRAAGELAALWLTGKVTRTKEEEVLDIDENLYRQEQIAPRLYGYLPIPLQKQYTQNRKCASPPDEAASMAAIGCRIADDMEPGVFYLVGAGTTTRAVMEQLGLPNTLIGVDLVKDGQLVGSDLYGQQILDLIQGHPAKLVLTVTGGQGFLFGRGNQQLTPAVLRAVGRENLIIAATREKLFRLRGQPLLADTGDAALDAALSGYCRVLTGYADSVVCRIAPG